MRILCLHGAGTNSNIFRIQTERFRALLPSDFEYEWLDGEVDSDPAPGIECIFPGPYLSYHDISTTEQLDDAHSQVKEFMKDEGPFDAVMGFSQGGALAASMILRHQIEQPYEPPLFRFAIFLCSSLPFSWDNNQAFDVTGLFVNGQAMCADLAEWKRYKKSHEGNGNIVRLDVSEMPASLRHVVARSSMADSEAKSLMIRRFHAGAVSVRIQIPTAHIIGKLDEYNQLSRESLKMCEPSLTISVEHSGGHEVPRTPEVSKAISDAIQRTITRSEFIA